MYDKTPVHLSWVHIAFEEIITAGCRSRKLVSRLCRSGDSFAHKDSFRLSAWNILVNRKIMRYPAIFVVEIESYDSTRRYGNTAFVKRNTLRG